MMSSAISTKRGLADASGPRPPASADEGFRPWHFFILASLAAATVAVLMSRQAAPEHLILVSLMIGASGAAAAALYRMLAPLAVRDATLVGQRQSERARTALEREKGLVLRSIKELEFDRAMGKVSPRDFDEMSARLRARAMMLIRQADEDGSGYRELIERELSARMVTRSRAGGGAQAAAESERESVAELVGAPAPASRTESPSVRHCAGCATANDPDAAFCKRCGERLEAGA